MKKLCAMLLVFSLFALCSGAAAEEARTAAEDMPEIRFCTEYTVADESYPFPLFAYDLLPDGTARITAYCGPDKDILIPESVDGIPVSTIGKNAIPDSTFPVITIPDCVTVIEANAFSNIHSSMRFNLSDTHPTLQVVDDVLVCPAEHRIIRGAIRGEYRIPEGIETIDDYAFWGGACRSIHIPASVSVLGRNPFAFCNQNRDTMNQLQEVTLSPDNTALEIRDGILFSVADHRLVWCFRGNRYDMHEEYTVPEDVEVIDDFALWRWGKLCSVTIPAGVKQIGVNPFNIGVYYEFEIALDYRNESFALADRMLISRADHRLVCAICDYAADTVTVPEGIVSVGDYAFYGLNNPAHPEVILPDSVAAVGDYAFAYSGCSVRIPADVRYIGSNAFCGCDTMAASLVFSGDVEIGPFAFSRCIYLDRLTVAGSARIGSYAFSDCSGLREVWIGKGDSLVMQSAFSNCSSLESAEFGKGFFFLGGGAFMKCGSLRRVSLPASLAYIGGTALYNVVTEEYNEQYDMYIPVYSSTVHAEVASGSYAEMYCRELGIDYTAR